MTERKFLGYCAEMKRYFNLDCGCCDSCHDDFDEGYDYMVTKDTKNGYYYVCCEVSNTYDDMVKARQNTEPSTGEEMK